MPGAQIDQKFALVKADDGSYGMVYQGKECLNYDGSKADGSECARWEKVEEEEPIECRSFGGVWLELTRVGISHI